MAAPSLAENNVMLTSMEYCPSDSIYIEGVCKCNPDYCSKPPCLTTLNIEKIGTNEPGNCCTTYTCDGCEEKDKINGKCPCAPNATLNSENVCECVDPHRTLSDSNVCECDKRKCSLPQICDKESVPIKVPDGCCFKTHCVKCPPDSYPTMNYSDKIEDKCICLKCKEPECDKNERVKIHKHANGTPGMCCDLYNCEAKTQNTTCLIGDVRYPEGHVWETAEAVCKCRQGISLCNERKTNSPQQFCIEDGKVYQRNETWMRDPCTNCTCLNGEPKCIAHLCGLDVNHVETINDCPPMEHCSKDCPSGLKTDKRGCKLCKCAHVQLDDFLYEYNISKSELELILENWHDGLIDAPTTTSLPTTVLYCTDCHKAGTYLSTYIYNFHCCSLTIKST